MAFKDLGLNQTILSTLDKLGYTEPTPIQAQAIPPVLEGLDVMAAAQTGTGKTAGFTLPILHRLIDNPIAKPKGNQVRVLVLTPTRELAAQVAQSVQDYGQDLNVKTVVVFGGVGINPQMQKLRGGADVLIATPGRLLDLHNQGAVKFDQLEVFILDEADRMLDMGFIIDIKKIMKFLPKKRQNLLFSATFSDDIRNLAKGIVNNPVEVSVTPPNSTVDAIKQSLIAVEKADKTMVLVRLMQENDWFQVLVFARTRHGASRLAGKLEKQGINAMAIHGDKSQSQRTRALAQFKDGKLRVLVATDIAARGIDIEQLPQVINFDLPQVAEDYVHRIGRTGRAGKTGHALSLVSHDEYKQLTDNERFIKKEIPREYLDGYEPTNNLKESKGDFSDRKPKKAKAPRGGKGGNGGQGAKADKPGRGRGDKPAGRGRSETRDSKPKAKSGSPSPWGKRDDSKRSDSRRKPNEGEGRGRSERPNNSRNEDSNRSGGARSGGAKSDGRNARDERGGRPRASTQGSTKADRPKDFDSNVSMKPAAGADGPNRKQRRAALRAEYDRANPGAKSADTSKKNTKR